MLTLEVIIHIQKLTLQQSEMDITSKGTYILLTKCISSTNTKYSSTLCSLVKWKLLDYHESLRKQYFTVVAGRGAASVFLNTLYTDSLVQ